MDIHKAIEVMVQAFQSAQGDRQTHVVLQQAENTIKQFVEEALKPDENVPKIEDILKPVEEPE